MNKFNLYRTKRIIAMLLALSALTFGFTACNQNDDTTSNNEVNTNVESGADKEIELPENENKKQEIITNENYADSDLFDFEGTVDEIYEDGSMLIYSPYFGVNFNYKVIVELDANTDKGGFEPKIGNQIKFNVYSAVKKSEPLTVVAHDMALVKETSTQRQEEEARIKRAEENLKKFLEGEKK